MISLENLSVERVYRKFFKLPVDCMLSRIYATAKSVDLMAKLLDPRLQDNSLDKNVDSKGKKEKSLSI